MREAVRREDCYALARLDATFHRRLCALFGNDVLVRTWEPLSLQLTIIFGLCALEKELAPTVVEHEEIVAALRDGDPAALASLMETHICERRRSDQEAVLARLEAAAGGVACTPRGLPRLEVEDLLVGFGKLTMVDGVSFSVAASKTLGLVGESGCGKSLTALALMGLLPPGASLFGATPLARGRGADGSLRAANARAAGGAIGMVFQEPMTALNPVLTVGT